MDGHIVFINNREIWKTWWSRTQTYIIILRLLIMFHPLIVLIIKSYEQVVFIITNKWQWNSETRSQSRKSTRMRNVLPRGPVERVCSCRPPNTFTKMKHQSGDCDWGGYISQWLLTAAWHSGALYDLDWLSRAEGQHRRKALYGWSMWSGLSCPSLLPSFTALP